MTTNNPFIGPFPKPESDPFAAANNTTKVTSTVFAKPSFPPARTAGQIGSQFKLFLQRQRLARILGQRQLLSSPSLLGG